MIIRMCLQVPIGTCFLSKSKFLNHHTKLLNFGYLSQIRWVTIGSQILENAHKQRVCGVSSHSSPAKREHCAKRCSAFFSLTKPQRDSNKGGFHYRVQALLLYNEKSRRSRFASPRCAFVLRLIYLFAFSFCHKRGMALTVTKM